MSKLYHLLDLEYSELHSDLWSNLLEKQYQKQDLFQELIFYYNFLAIRIYLLIFFRAW
jgi:hypothetical protein